MNTYEEQFCFESNLALNLENSLHNCFFNFRESNKFSPDLLSEFISYSKEKNIDYSFNDDGIYYLDTYSNGTNYYLDIYSGLIYYKDGDNFKIAKGACASKDYDLIDAAYLRKCLNHPESKRKFLILPNEFYEVTSLDYLGHDLNSIFYEPILEYNVSTLQELKSLITELSSRLSECKFYKKIWLRGQRQEYTISRSRKTLERLGIPMAYSTMPSLIPSLGRQIDSEHYNEFHNSNMLWEKAFRVWALCKCEDFKKYFVGSKLYNELIKHIDPEGMTKIIYNSEYDLSEILFSNGSITNDATLAMQQYGGLTSVLDITDDLDVALFFTQSFLNTETKRFELCEPNRNSIIYIFAQNTNSSTVNLSTDLFNYSSILYDLKVPKRILNQKCGILHGANVFAQNNYGYRVIAKINLTSANIYTNKTVEEMFPNVDEDDLFKVFSDAIPTLKGLYG